MENKIKNTCLACKEQQTDDSHIPEEVKGLDLYFCSVCWSGIFKEQDSLLSSSFSMSESQSKDFGDLLDAKDDEICKEHNKKAKLLCVQDKCRICKNCVVFGTHKGHEVIAADDAFNQHKAKTSKLFYLTKLIQFYSWRFTEEKEKKIRSQEKELCGLVNAKFNEFIDLVTKKRDETIREIKNFYQDASESVLLNTALLSRLIGWKEKIMHKLQSQENQKLLWEENYSKFDTLNDDDVLKASENLKKWIQCETQEQEKKSFEKLNIVWGSSDALLNSLCNVTVQKDSIKKEQLELKPEKPVEVILNEKDELTVQTLLRFFVISVQGNLLNVNLPRLTEPKLLVGNDSLYSDLKSWFSLEKRKLIISLCSKYYIEKFSSPIIHLLSSKKLCEISIDIVSYEQSNKEFESFFTSLKDSINQFGKLDKFVFKFWGKKSSQITLPGTAYYNLITTSPSLTYLSLWIDNYQYAGKSIYDEGLLSRLKRLKYLNKLILKAEFGERDINEIITSLSSWKYLRYLAIYRITGGFNCSQIVNITKILEHVTQLEELYIDVVADDQFLPLAKQILKNLTVITVLKVFGFRFVHLPDSSITSQLGTMVLPFKLKFIKS